jgi:peptidyl-tRNA hydrolase, PTH1 family
VSRLVVGLGNPGKRYENTRHNLGFLTVREFADCHAISLKKGWRIKGELGSGTVDNEVVKLLLPTTYMNLSGRALIQMMNYYKISVEDLLVVVDDIYLPFGEIRPRSEGSSGGHNGLKSIEQVLGTRKFARLRMGIGEERAPGQSLESYVLENFTLAESEKLPKLTRRGTKLIESWLKHGIEECAKQAGSFGKLE